MKVFFVVTAEHINTCRRDVECWLNFTQIADSCFDFFVIFPGNTRSSK